MIPLVWATRRAWPPGHSEQHHSEERQIVRPESNRLSLNGKEALILGQVFMSRRRFGHLCVTVHTADDTGGMFSLLPPLSSLAKRPAVDSNHSPTLLWLTACGLPGANQDKGPIPIG